MLHGRVLKLGLVWVASLFKRLSAVSQQVFLNGEVCTKHAHLTEASVLPHPHMIYRSKANSASGSFARQQYDAQLGSYY